MSRPAAVQGPVVHKTGCTLENPCGGRLRLDTETMSDLVAVKVTDRAIYSCMNGHHHVVGNLPGPGELEADQNRERAQKGGSAPRAPRGRKKGRGVGAYRRRKKS